MFFYANIKCSCTVTFANDTLEITSVLVTVVILTFLVASRIPNLTTICTSPCLKFPRHITPVIHEVRVGCYSHYFSHQEPAHDFIVVLADRSRRGSVLAGSLVFSCHGMAVCGDLAEYAGCRTS